MSELSPTPAALPSDTLPLSATSPLTGANRHVSFILLSEFDILKGSNLKFSYPATTHLPDSVLAEAMLPEGAHLRESDWTIFFITNDMRKKGKLLTKEKRAKEREKREKKRKRLLGELQQAATEKGQDVSSVTLSPAELEEEKKDKEEEIFDNDARNEEVIEQQEQGYWCVLNLVRTKKDKTVKR